MFEAGVDNTKKIMEAVEELTKTDILVGIPASNNTRPDTPIGNAAIGMIMERGMPSKNIPARPWLEPGVKDNQKKISQYLEQAGRAAMEGDTARVRRLFDAAGLTTVNTVRAKIINGPFVPLAPRTVAARKSRHKGRLNSVELLRPLNDTGQMRKAVTYVLRKRKK